MAEFGEQSGLSIIKLHSTAQVTLGKLNALLDESTSSYKNNTIRSLKNLLSTNLTFDKFQDVTYVLALKEAIESMQETIRSSSNLIVALEVTPQADVGQLKSSENLDTVINQNATDMTGGTMQTSTAGQNKSDKGPAISLTDMGDYLSRPVEIANYDFFIGNTSDRFFDVWKLFTDAPSVRAKLRNFAYLRGDLKVRISISGTPFHYGTMLVSYQPYHDFNMPLSALKSSVATDYSLRPALIGYLSQAEGSALIDMKTNTPLEIVCPFISPKPVMRLYDSSAVVAGSFPDMTVAGALYLYSVDLLRAVSTGATSVNIQVYAWMDNVQLGTNTATQLAVTTESSVEEFSIGPIERVCTRANEVTSSLSQLVWMPPIIHSLDLVTGALASLAKLHGWSKPILDSDMLPVRNAPMANTATFLGNSTARSLRLDPAGALNLSSAATAINYDQMKIATLAGRWSFIKHLLWDETNSTMTTPIFTCKVNPLLSATAVSTVNTFIQPSAMAFAAMPFGFWRGTISFRIEIAASAFHRGKFLIYHEPNIAQSVLINANIALNKQYLQIVDIQETRVVEFDVEWTAAREWLRMPPSTAPTTNIDFTTPLVDGEGFSNGYIGVVPFTKLQSPDGSPVEVHVYVCSKDLQVVQPRTFGVARYVLPQSYVVTPQSMTCHLDPAPTEMSLNATSANTLDLCSRYFGEQVISLRSLLKRYITYHVSNYNATINTNQNLSITIPRTPPITSYSTVYAVVSLKTFDYISPAYLGMTGSHRWILTTNMRANMGHLAPVKSSLGAITSIDVTSFVLVNGDSANDTSVSGTVIDIPNTNGGIEIEAPLYTNNLFLLACWPAKEDGGISFETSWSRNVLFTVPSLVLDATQRASVWLDSSIGEDFNLHRYLGAPYYVLRV